MVDLYPTRVSDESSLIKRVEPVIHGDSFYLTEFQNSSYDTNGYLVIRDFFMKEELQHVMSASDKLFFDPPDNAILEPGSETVRSVFCVHEEKDFSCLLQNDALRGISTEILGSGDYIHQSRINYKAGLGSTGWRWHSDFETWHAEDGMPTMRCFTAMIPLTDNIESNGPLMIIPGSHKTFLSCVGGTPENNYAQHLQDQKVGLPTADDLNNFIVNSGGRVDSLTCRVGDLVLFDSNCMHGSNANITPYNRTNLFYVFNSVENVLLAPYCGRPHRPKYVASQHGQPSH